MIIDLSHPISTGWARHWGTPRYTELDCPHLTNLWSVPGDGARLTALPAPVLAMASFPVRAVAACAP